MPVTRKPHTSLGYKIAHSRVTIAILLCLCLILGYSTVGAVMKRRQAHETVTRARLEREELKAREIALNRDIENLKTEEGKEEIIRNKYRAHKEGEGLIVVTGNKPIAAPSKEIVEKKNFFDRLREWFEYLF